MEERVEVRLCGRELGGARDKGIKKRKKRSSSDKLGAGYR